MNEPRWKNKIVGQGVENPAQLLANPQNWRLHPKEQQESLAEGLDQVGWIQQVIVNRTTGHMIDGHLRVELALQQDESEVPVVYVELSEQEERIALATLDPIGAMAETDREKLLELTEDLDPEQNPALDFMFRDIIGDVDSTGYGSGDGEHDANTVPPVSEGIITEEGQVWELGRHRLACGSCENLELIEALCDGAKMDSLVSDPPYGVDYTSKNEFFNEMDKQTRVTRPILGDGAFKPGEFTPWAESWLENAKSVMGDKNTIYLFISGRNHHNLTQAIENTGGYKASDLVWVKNGHVLSRQDYSAKHESILYGWWGTHRFYGPFSHTVIDHEVDLDDMDYQPLLEYAKSLREMLREDVIRHPKPNVSDLHPTMKPVELLVKLIRDGSPESTGNVLDLFGGSGSTLMACEVAGRNCYMTEMEPHYCDVIIRRWQDYTGETAYNAETGEAFPSA